MDVTQRLQYITPITLQQSQQLMEIRLSDCMCMTYTDAYRHL